VRVTAHKPRKTAADIAAEIMDPTGTPDNMKRPRIHVTVDLDIQRRLRKAEYEKAMREGEQWLGVLAEETGGNMSRPRSAEEMLANCEEITRAIDSQYIVTYRPKRPLASAGKEEYRRIDVAARRVGLSIATRRGYVVPPQSRQ
jgi:hypothetical protein